MAWNAWSNAVACAVGASVGRWGTLFQCSSEEAEELRIGMAGFTSYAETVSVYGTEKSFIDGDDTPWSKAFLAAAYASRGIKMRCTSGAGSELLMGFHEKKSLLYLEARCLCLQRAMGVQGTQNGGIDGAVVADEVMTRGEKSQAIGYNAVTGEYEDMFKAGVIDPTKVTRSALNNAASIAGLMLTTEVMITKIDEDEPKNKVAGAIR